MRSVSWGGGYLGVRRAAFVALGVVVLGGAACTVVSEVPDGGEGPDAAPTSSSTIAVPTGTVTATAVPDAALPSDASPDAPADGSSDAEADGGAADSAADGATDAGPAVTAGSDGVLRGLVGGVRNQDWVGKIRLPNATCPAGATTITAGAISCCSFGGNFNSSAGRFPVVFDLTTRSGTLAGAPIGPFPAPIIEVDGTMRFQAAAFLEGPKAWRAGVEIARANAAVAGELAEATRMYETPALMRAVSDSLRSMVVTWNPTTSEFRIRFDLTNFQATADGTCGIPGGQETFARLQFDLR